MEGLALLILITSLKDYLLWFREDYLATCSLLGLFFNPIISTYNCLLGLGVFLQVAEVKPGWYRAMERLCGGKANDSHATYTFWSVTIPAFYGAYFGGVMQVRFTGPAHLVLAVDEKGDIALGSTLWRLLVCAVGAATIIIFVLKVTPKIGVMRTIVKKWVLPFIICLYFYGIGCPIGQ